MPMPVSFKLQKTISTTTRERLVIICRRLCRYTVDIFSCSSKESLFSGKITPPFDGSGVLIHKLELREGPYFADDLTNHLIFGNAADDTAAAVDG